MNYTYVYNLFIIAFAKIVYPEIYISTCFTSFQVLISFDFMILNNLNDDLLLSPITNLLYKRV